MSWSFLLNPKVWGILLIILIFGGIYYKYNSLQTDFINATTSLKQEKDNNVILRSNIDTLSQANAQNALILQQQAINAKTTVETVIKLSNELKRINQSFNDTKIRIDTITDAPVPLTSYLKEAINGIQTEREIINPPTLKDAPK